MISQRQVYDIERIDFGMLSPEDIRGMAVCKVDSTKLTGPGSVYDEKMGYVPDTNDPCVSCGEKKDCPGHIGYIDLPEPVLHPLFIKDIVRILRCFCKQCYSLLLNEDQIKIANLHKLTGMRRFNKIIKSLEKVDVCPSCSHPQPKIDFKKNESKKENIIAMTYKQKGNDKISVVLSVDDIKKILDNISDKHISLLGFDPTKIHPRDLIMTVLVVIPPCTRPYVKTDGDNICDDDLTYQLLEILKICKQYEKLDLAKDEQKRQKLYQSLQFRIETTFNNNGGRAKHPTDNRTIKDIKQRISGKTGRIRGNLMGKRNNFSARTVIGAEPTLKLDEVGIPYEVARTHTKPVAVTTFNIKELTEIVNTDRANFVIKNNGKTRINLKYAMFQRGTPLLYGDIVLRGNVDVKEDEDGNLIPRVDTFTVKHYIDKEEVFLKKGTTVIKKRKQLVIIEKDDKYIIKNCVVICGKVDIKQDKNGKYVIPVQTFNGRIIHVREAEVNLCEGDRVIRDGKFIEVLLPKRKNIRLEIGDIVERHLQRNDVVLFNRQPTLHKGSMLAMRAVPMPFKTFRFNLAATKSFNADFDGDEINVSLEQQTAV